MVLGFGHHHSNSQAEHPDEPRGRPVAVGRGGAGNIRSASRSSAAGPDADEQAAHDYVSEHPPNAVSSGRGGAGNVRSPSRDPTERAHVVQEELHEQEVRDEYRRHEANSSHFAPTGRGGRGNLHHEGSERGRGASAERGRKEGPMGTLFRTLSRSRSRDTGHHTAESPSRVAAQPAPDSPHVGPSPLANVAETPEAGESAESVGGAH